MLRVRHFTVVAVAALTLSACGTSTNNAGKTKAAKKSAAAASTTTVAGAHNMTPEQMAHMKPTVLPGHPLSVLADGTFDPTKIDLSGTPGVTAAEQHRAEALLKKTLLVLPHWADVETAKKEGFHSIGDGLTGDEHFIHWDWINDNTWLDPHKPEALVYHYDYGTGKHTLEAVMFLLPQKFTFNNLPDIGGPLTQFHIHDNLCFTDTMPAPQVAGLTDGEGKCHAPLVKFHPNVMMHVWIRPNPCGPFAALEGVGAGQVKPGDTRACDEMHGASL